MRELAIGWAAGVGSAVAFGSFGVPLKSPAVVAARVRPECLESTEHFCLMQRGTERLADAER
jgi:hypothetical protein